MSNYELLKYVLAKKANVLLAGSGPVIQSNKEYAEPSMLATGVGGRLAAKRAKKLRDKAQNFRPAATGIAPAVADRLKKQSSVVSPQMAARRQRAAAVINKNVRNKLRRDIRALPPVPRTAEGRALRDVRNSVVRGVKTARGLPGRLAGRAADLERKVSKTRLGKAFLSLKTPGAIQQDIAGTATRVFGHKPRLRVLSKTKALAQKLFR